MADGGGAGGHGRLEPPHRRRCDTHGDPPLVGAFGPRTREPLSLPPVFWGPRPARPSVPSPYVVLLPRGPPLLPMAGLLPPDVLAVLEAREASLALLAKRLDAALGHMAAENSAVDAELHRRGILVDATALIPDDAGVGPQGDADSQRQHNLEAARDEHDAPFLHPPRLSTSYRQMRCFSGARPPPAAAFRCLCGIAVS